MDKLRIVILIIVLLLTLNLYVAVNRAEEYSEMYTDDRLMALQIRNGTGFLTVDDPEVLYIESQGKFVWKKMFISSFVKGGVVVAGFSLICFVSVLVSGRKWGAQRKVKVWDKEKRK